MTELPKTAQGIMKLADADEIKKDNHGFTHPNLHRRIEEHLPNEDSGEVAPRQYTIGIYDSIHSTRLTKINYHDEESTTSEIP